MKYGYTELIKDSKCNTCLGCNRLELEEFKGVYRCENYMRGVTDDKDRNTIIATKQEK